MRLSLILHIAIFFAYFSKACIFAYFFPYKMAFLTTILIFFCFLLPLSIRFRYLDHLVANRRCLDPCGTRYVVGFKQFCTIVLLHIWCLRGPHVKNAAWNCHALQHIHAAASLVCELLHDLSVGSHDRLTLDAWYSSCWYKQNDSVTAECIRHLSCILLVVLFALTGCFDRKPGLIEAFCHEQPSSLMQLLHLHVSGFTVWYNVIIICYICVVCTFRITYIVFLCFRAGPVTVKQQGDLLLWCCGVQTLVKFCKYLSTVYTKITNW